MHMGSISLFGSFCRHFRSPARTYTRARQANVIWLRLHFLLSFIFFLCAGSVDFISRGLGGWHVSVCDKENHFTWTLNDKKLFHLVCTLHGMRSCAISFALYDFIFFPIYLWHTAQITVCTQKCIPSTAWSIIACSWCWWRRRCLHFASISLSSPAINIRKWKRQQEK